MAHVYDSWKQEDIEKLYLDEDLTRKELAYQLGVSTTTLGEYLREENIYKTELRSEEEMESDIRAALAHLKGVNSELARQLDILPVSKVYGRPDTWVINNYIPPTEDGNSFPIEVTMKYDRRRDSLTVTKFELRGTSRADLQRKMNLYLI